MGLLATFYEFLHQLIQACLSLSSKLVGGCAPFTPTSGEPTLEQGTNVGGKEKKRETATY